MATLTGLITRAAAPARAARAQLRALRSPRRTALHVPADRMPPPPRAFARFGEGSWIVPPARVDGSEAIEIGAGVVVMDCGGLHVDARAGARLVIGDGSRLAKGAEIVCATSVTIGAAVSTSDYVTITDCWGALGDRGAPPGAPVVVEDGAYLGWGSVICPGVRVGAGAFVGEGAVVLDDVAPHAVVYGNPASPAERYGARPA